MDSKEFERLNDQYEALGSFLLYFLEDAYYDDRTDKDTIKREIETFDSEEIRLCIAQGREVLGLKEFPDEWVQDLINWLPKGEDTVPQDYHDWLKEQIDTLEVEAQKAGKL